MFCLANPALASALIFSGSVVGVSADTGTLILRKGKKSRITLTGLRAARIRAVDGRIIPLEGLRVGMKVSVAYETLGRRTVVSRILVPAASAPELAPSITDPRHRTLFDGDPTTKPGASAATDGDITTKPPRSADTDGDITTRSDR